MTRAHNPDFWPRIFTLVIFLLFGGLIGTMGRAIAVQLGMGFFTGPVWLSGMIFVYVGTTMFGHTMLRNFADWFRLPIIVPEPDPATRRLSAFVWSIFLIGSLTGYLLTTLILKGVS
ncbi:hypothetical protein [Falsihalocynthiibacter arcticus]|uniref:Uncharacterized protein n=1 Tax=Falsihalocynthiibacter arcticus TaxID=1579316 RepID=A0A126UWK3_9RHOB|nr:hypothetical protein [Falsihalocynthiibacter arcticus]AML50105.1 hypothetical protein RC74_01375 [Falsihalocynthiibacter arcticus]